MAAVAQRERGITHPAHRLQFALEGVRGGERPVVDEGGGRLGARSRSDGVEHPLHRLSQEQVVSIGGTDIQAELARQLGLDAARQPLAVDEHAVTVEDDRPRSRAAHVS